MGQETNTHYPAGINKRKLPIDVDALKKQKQETAVDLSAPNERDEEEGGPNGNANFIDNAVAKDNPDEEGGVPNGSADGKGKGVLIATSPVQDKGKGKTVVLDKGKSVMLEEDEDEDGSDDDSDDSDDAGAIRLGNGEDSSDFDDDPLAELDLDNVLPSRTRRKQPPPPGSYLVIDSDEEDDDDDDGFD